MKGLATFLMTFRKEKKNPYRIWRNNMSSLEKGNMRLAKHRPFFNKLWHYYLSERDNPIISLLTCVFDDMLCIGIRIFHRTTCGQSHHHRMLFLLEQNIKILNKSERASSGWHSNKVNLFFMNILLPIKYRCSDHILIKSLMLFNILAAEIQQNTFSLFFFNNNLHWCLTIAVAAHGRHHNQLILKNILK